MISERLIKWIDTITNKERESIDHPFRLRIGEKTYSAATDGRAFVVIESDFYTAETLERFSKTIVEFVSEAQAHELKAVRVSLEAIRQFSIPCEPTAVTCDECGADLGLVQGFGYWKADPILFHGKHLNRDLLWHALAPLPGSECLVRIPKDHIKHPFIFKGDGWIVGLMGMQPNKEQLDAPLPFDSFDEEL